MPDGRLRVRVYCQIIFDGIRAMLADYARALLIASDYFSAIAIITLFIISIAPFHATILRY